MNKQETELYLERTFNKGRKEISGRGAISTKVRIMEDVIFTKMKMDYTGLSINMFKHISESSNGEEAFYHSVRPQVIEYADKVLAGICELRIAKIHFKIDMENKYSFATIVLTGDLDKLISEGKVTKPSEC